MTFKSRLLSSVFILAMLVPVSAEAAGKRRAVTPRSPGAPFTTQITGTLTDAVTGQPVRNARVSGGRRSTSSDDTGKFDLKFAEGFGDVILFDVERSGYVLYRARLTGAGPHTLNLQLQPTPTVSLRKTDNSTLQLDYESFKFAYAVPFSGFRSSESESFCIPNGGNVDIHKAEMKRLVGPATATASSCCTARNALKMTLERKSGGSSEIYFIDSCETEYTMEIIGTDHVTGQAVDIPLTDIAEVVFP